MAATYPGRWYQLGITVCVISRCRYSSSPKIFSSKRRELPDVEMLN